jgi:hypothetical protein
MELGQISRDLGLAFFSKAKGDSRARVVAHVPLRNFPVSRSGFYEMLAVLSGAQERMMQMDSLGNSKARCKATKTPKFGARSKRGSAIWTQDIHASHLSYPVLAHCLGVHLNLILKLAQIQTG